MHFFQAMFSAAVRSLLSLLLLGIACSPALAQIERIWLTHRTTTPSRVVVNWISKTPGYSEVHFGPTDFRQSEIRIQENVTLHHVEIPVSEKDAVCHYSVKTGDQESSDAVFKTYAADELRVAVVADWQRLPDLPGIVRDNVHLLLTAGDNIPNLYDLCGAGNPKCIKPYSKLIGRYPDLFRSTPFMPILGNHDKQIRPRGPRPPAKPVYDVDATAFRRFFELPNDEWKWYFEVPQFGVRFVALDLNHMADMGTTWQSCHPYDEDSVQYRWYKRLMDGPKPPFVVTLYNAQNVAVRAQAGGAWGRLLAKGTIAITGYGYFAERAEVDGMTYYDTSLSGKGDRYPDPHSKFLRSEDNYILLTFTKNPRKMTVEIKRLDGTVLDRKQY